VQHSKTLKHLIKDAGMNYDTLATKLGVDKSQISYWNTGKKTPRLDNAARLAKELGVSLRCLSQALGVDVAGIPNDLGGEEPISIDL
jgi:transcriptional regulator with XRE-family HTH domain